MKKVIKKTVNLDLVGVNGNAFAIMGAFRKQAKNESWSEDEINAVLNEAKSKDYDYLVATILNHCELNSEENKSIDSNEVWEILQQLGHHTHYLATKPIATWDAYDRSNYQSLRIKAGKDKF